MGTGESGDTEDGGNTLRTEGGGGAEPGCLELAMAARLRELEAQAGAVGLKLGGFGWTAVRLGFVGFELAGVAMHVGAVFEVETGCLEGLCSSRQVVASSPSDSEDNSSSPNSSACC